MRMKTELPFLTDTVSVCELLRDFSQAPCGAADPAGFVVHPRRAPPAVLSVDSKRRVQLPFLPAQLLPRALFTCQKKVDFFFSALHFCLAVQFGYPSIRRLPMFFHV